MEDHLSNHEMKELSQKDKKGNNIGAVSCYQDLTERKKAELELKQAYCELQEAKEYLENVISTTVDGIIITDPQGMITRVNEAVEKTTGYTQEELKEMHISQLSRYDDEVSRQTT